jgi:hypothetical protein
MFTWSQRLDLLCLAAKLPLVGCYGGSTLPPAPAYELWLTSESIESPDRSCPIPSHCIGQCGSKLPFREVWSPRDG